MTQQSETLNRTLADRYAQAVAPFVTPGQPYALLDYPDYANIGDSAIYAGQLTALDAIVGQPPAYVCSLKSYRQDIASTAPTGPLLVTGGGNFGDLWPRHQRFRIDVLTRYQDRPIIQLPQSIKFHDLDGDLLEQTRRAIGTHPNYTLMVRDLPSKEFAQQNFDCAVTLAPDAAHCMGTLTSGRQAQGPVLSLLRDDKEGVFPGLDTQMAAHGKVADWPRLPFLRTPVDRLVESVVAPRRPTSAPLMRRREAMYRRHAWARVRAGVDFLAQGRLVVSDRLHAHLLCSLMGKRHISLDNSYGKIARYIDAFGQDDTVIKVQSNAALQDVLPAELARA